MKFIYLILIAFSVVYASSCNNDSSSGSGGIGPGGGGGTGSVTFTMQGQGDPTSYNFYFKPSVDVKVSKIIAKLAAQNFTDTVVNNAPNYVFSKDSSYTWYNYTGVQTGQAWSFTFTGNINSGGSAYTSSANFNVP